jgi:hypothetical protein
MGLNKKILIVGHLSIGKTTLPEAKSVRLENLKKELDKSSNAATNENVKKSLVTDAVEIMSLRSYNKTKNLESYYPGKSKRNQRRSKKRRKSKRK